MTDYKVSLIRIFRPLDVVFFVLADIILIALLVQAREWRIQLVLAIMTSIFLYASIDGLFKPFFVRMQLTIDDDYLVVTENLFGIVLNSESFYVYDIKSIAIEENFKESGSYWHIAGIKFYNKTPKVLTFMYENKKMHVGISYYWLDIEEFIDELQKRKTTSKEKFNVKK